MPINIHWPTKHRSYFGNKYLMVEEDTRAPHAVPTLVCQGIILLKNLKKGCNLETTAFRVMLHLIMMRKYFKFSLIP